MSFTSLTNAEVDAKSPIDDALMGKVQGDLDDLNSRVIVAGASPFLIEVIGKLDYIRYQKTSLAMGIVNAAFTPSRCRFMLKKSGTSPSGTLGFDLRKHTSPKTPITSILAQYSGLTTSIARAGAGNSTQSIARASAQISTQSITFAKAVNNVQSIMLLGAEDTQGANLVIYNLASQLDSDTLVGDSVVISGCTTGANNGTFTVVEKNRGGGSNVVVTNASGVAQAGAVGSLQVPIISYNYTNPVNALFTAGYSHKFTTHTTGANNGTFLVYAINQAGNNIWVKNSVGVVQAGVAGTADTNLWIFALSVAASVTDYVVGESAKTSGHSSGVNDVAALPIIAVNSGGNNLVLYNSAGATQGGVAGTINTNRWVYAMPTDPSSNVSAGYGVYLTAHTNALNNGYFVAKEVNRSAANNVVVYNESGVAQASTPGLLVTTRKIVSFSADQSAVYSTASYIQMQGSSERLYNYFWAYAPFQVVQVNRGGGANYNVVIECADSTVYAAADQASPSGYVQVEMRSIFNTAPTLAYSVTGVEPDRNIVGTSTDLIATVIPTQTPLMLYMTTYPNAGAESLTVFIQ